MDCSTIDHCHDIAVSMDHIAPYNIKKVHKRSAEVQAADALRDAIISGDIPLGARLTEISAAEQIGVSRATIRTAFHQLVRDGLIVQVPYTGWTVMTLSAPDAWELYTLRASLEALAARLVARRIRDDKHADPIRTAIDKAFQRLEKACKSGRNGDIAKEDMNLHKTIVDLSGHGRLRDQYALIQNQILIYIQSSDALVGDPETIVAQHVPLIEALLSGDEAAAIEAAVSHNEREGGILVAFLENREHAGT